MKIEITPEQYNQIQEEVIRLEEELVIAEVNIYTCSVWRRVDLYNKITELKRILKTNEIEI